MKTNIVVWDKNKIRLQPITEVDSPNPIRPVYHPRIQAQEVCQFLVGHITGDTYDYLIREIAAIALPYDQINDENIKNMEVRISSVINRLADNRGQD